MKVLRRRAVRTRLGALISCVGLATALTIAVAPSVGAATSGDVTPYASCNVTLHINTDNEIYALAGTCPLVKVNQQRYQSDVGYIDYMGNWGTASGSGYRTVGKFVFNAEMHELPAGTFTPWDYVR